MSDSPVHFALSSCSSAGGVMRSIVWWARRFRIDSSIGPRAGGDGRAWGSLESPASGWSLP